MQRAARRGPAVVAAVLIQSWCASTALAQTPQGATVPDAAPPPDSTRMVDVTIIAGGDDADTLLGSIRELLGRLGLGVDPHVVAVAPPLQPPQPTAGLSVWVDLASRYEAVTIVRNGRSEVRRTIPRDSSPAIVREEIGEAVRSGVEAELQADAARNAPPPPAPSAPPAPAPPPVAGPEKLPPPPTSPRWFALDLTVFGGRRTRREQLGAGGSDRRRRRDRIEATPTAVADGDGRVLRAVRRRVRSDVTGAHDVRVAARGACDRSPSHALAGPERGGRRRRRHHLRRSVRSLKRSDDPSPRAVRPRPGRPDPDRARDSLPGAGAERRVHDRPGHRCGLRCSRSTSSAPAEGRHPRAVAPSAPLRWPASRSRPSAASSSPRGRHEAGPGDHDRHARGSAARHCARVRQQSDHHRDDRAGAGHITVRGPGCWRWRRDGSPGSSVRQRTRAVRRTASTRPSIRPTAGPPAPNAAAMASATTPAAFDRRRTSAWRERGSALPVGEARAMTAILCRTQGASPGIPVARHAHLRRFPSPTSPAFSDVPRDGACTGRRDAVHLPRSRARRFGGELLGASRSCPTSGSPARSTPCEGIDAHRRVRRPSRWEAVTSTSPCEPDGAPI